MLLNFFERLKTIFLFCSDLKKEDFGNYVFEFDLSENKKLVDITVEEKDDKNTKRIIVGLSIAVAVFMIMIVLLYILFRCRIHVLWCWKRKYGKYEAGADNVLSLFI